MLPAEKEFIERCLASPDTFESSLKSYKAQYKNIEWGEKKPVIKNNESDSGLIEQDEDLFYVLVTDISQGEISKILYEAISSGKIRACQIALTYP